jgi:hypothetical protein
VQAAPMQRQMRLYFAGAAGNNATKKLTRKGESR